MEIDLRLRWRRVRVGDVALVEDFGEEMAPDDVLHLGLAEQQGPM